jgi:hypothetical protein
MTDAARVAAAELALPAVTTLVAYARILCPETPVLAMKWGVHILALREDLPEYSEIRELLLRERSDPPSSSPPSSALAAGRALVPHATVVWRALRTADLDPIDCVNVILTSLDLVAVGEELASWS